MKTILIIDDEVFARDHLARLIEKRGFKVLTADTGEQGIKIYKESRPDFVFLDILLPGIDGEEVFRYIREMDAGANIYFMTGCDDLFSIEQAIKMGGRGFFTKPLFVEDIMKLLDELKTSDGPVYHSPAGGPGEKNDRQP